MYLCMRFQRELGDIPEELLHGPPEEDDQDLESAHTMQPLSFHGCHLSLRFMEVLRRRS